MLVLYKDVLVNVHEGSNQYFVPCLHIARTYFCVGKNALILDLAAGGARLTIVQGQEPANVFMAMLATEIRINETDVRAAMESVRH
jgi:hypothetical protein